MEEGKKYKKEAGFEGREDEINAEVVMNYIYTHAFPHLRVAGFDKEVIKFCSAECDINFFRCPVLDAWKTVWDKPWLMCEIAKAYDEGFMFSE